jgi:hypothetical protein
MSKLSIFLIIVFIFFVIKLIILLSRKPSLNRKWSKDQEILPEINFISDKIEIKNMRNFSYTSINDYAINYYSQTFDLNNIKNLYFIIEPFSKYDGPAHTMFSFWFRDGSNIVFSAEIRKKIREPELTPFKWITRKYEIVYMIWNENDFIKLRANYRKDQVIMYPIKTPQEKIKKLFISMLNRADQLSKKPEFYNTITQNCTTTLLDHVNELREEKIPWSKEALFPSHSDKIIYDLGLIDTKLSLTEARKYYQINELSEEFWGDKNYSEKIRKLIK